MSIIRKITPKEFWKRDVEYIPVSGTVISLEHVKDTPTVDRLVIQAGDRKISFYSHPSGDSLNKISLSLPDDFAYLGGRLVFKVNREKFKNNFISDIKSVLNPEMGLAYNFIFSRNNKLY